MEHEYHQCCHFCQYMHVPDCLTLQKLCHESHTCKKLKAISFKSSNLLPSLGGSIDLSLSCDSIGIKVRESAGLNGGDSDTSCTFC